MESGKLATETCKLNMLNAEGKFCEIWTVSQTTNRMYADIHEQEAVSTCYVSIYNFIIKTTFHLKISSNGEAHRSIKNSYRPIGTGLTRITPLIKS